MYTADTFIYFLNPNSKKKKKLSAQKYFCKLHCLNKEFFSKYWNSFSCLRFKNLFRKHATFYYILFWTHVPFSKSMANNSIFICAIIYCRLLSFSNFTKEKKNNIHRNAIPKVTLLFLCFYIAVFTNLILYNLFYKYALRDKKVFR